MEEMPRDQMYAMRFVMMEVTIIGSNVTLELVLMEMGVLLNVK